MVNGDFAKLTRKHGIKISAGFPCTVEDIGLAVGEKVGHSSIKSLARMNSAVVIFLDQVEKVNRVIETGITELMYISDGPNYILVHTLLDSLQRDLHWFISPPDGSKQQPASTCLELWLAHPNSTNGMYYIDPNQGSPADALQVFCDFSAEPKTCLPPLQPQVPVKAWLSDSGPNLSFHWLSSVKDGFQFEYPGGTDVVQMRFLRLKSRFCTQTVTYSCQRGTVQNHREREVQFLSDTRRQSYLGALPECALLEPLQSEVQESVLQFESEDLHLLPLRDLAVFGNKQVTTEFGFTVGPACFS